MSVIWKFPLPQAKCEVEMPQWARIVHFGIDPAADCPAVWAAVNPDAKKEVRKFAVVGTGSEIPHPSVYTGTVIDGSLVWHLFDLTESSLLDSMLGAFR